MRLSPAAVRRLFTWSAIYGLLVLVPHYFLERRIGLDYPPAITHPEHFYGFVGTALAWQAAFLIIARDPARHRLLMLPAALEKLLFLGACVVLAAQGRIPGPLMAFAGLDGLLGSLFLWAFLSTEAGT